MTINTDISGCRICIMITSQKEKGNVVFKSGKTVINASTVIMDSGTIVEDGAELIINTKK